MERRHFGSTRREVSVVGQGTWNIEAAARETVVSVLRRGLDLEMTHIDTAEMYGSGAAEELIGEAINGPRDEVFLVSKVLPHNASQQGARKSCENSLRRLRTDHLDCYLLHWRGAHPLEETVAAFEELRAEGKILSWGVSNFDVDDLEELWAVSSHRRPACNQVLYHLGERAIEHAVLPWCEAHDIAVVAYSPFGQDNFPKENSHGGRVLAEIAAHRNATPRRVALAFLTRRPSLFAIPKAASMVHLEDNAAAGDLQLSEGEIGRIDTAFPLGRRPAELPMI